MLEWTKRRFKRTIRILESQAAYRLWANDYLPSPHNPLMVLEHHAMLELMPSLRDQTVLDLACGTGRWGKFAQEHGAKAVVGIDNSFAMLKQCVLEKRAVSDLGVLPFGDGRFDVILCGLAVGHLPADRIRGAICEMGRVLVSGGVLLISDLHPFQALNGAQRTFQGEDGKQYAVEHYIHRYEDYHRMANEAGLRIMDVREPSHPDSKLRKTPVVLVLRFEKEKS